MKIITTSNGKGGTGKTTLNAFIGETLFNHNYKVLLIDLDHNCCLSEMYGMELKDETSKNFLSGKNVTPYNIKKTDTAVLDIIPSDLDMNMLANIMDTQLKVQIKKSGLASKYDFIILDPPGTWNAQTRNAVFAADTVVVSGTCSQLDLKATEKYFEQLSGCYLDADVFVVCNKFNKQLNLDGIFEAYQKSFDEFLISFPIPDVKSLKKLVADPNYKMHPTIKNRLEKFVEIVTEVSFNQEDK